MTHSYHRKRLWEQFWASKGVSVQAGLSECVCVCRAGTESCISRMGRTTHNLRDNLWMSLRPASLTSVPLLPPWEQLAWVTKHFIVLLLLFSRLLSHCACTITYCCAGCTLHNSAAILWPYFSVSITTLQIIYPANILNALEYPERFMPFYM